MSDKIKTFESEWNTFNERAMRESGKIAEYHDNYVLKNCCEFFYNAAIESMQEEIDKRDARIKDLLKTVRASCPCKMHKDECRECLEIEKELNGVKDE